MQPSATPTTLAPWLTVRDGAKAVEFYRQAFGVFEVYRLDSIRMILTVTDSDALFAQALAAGARRFFP